jgi:hypothetical protein
MESTGSMLRTFVSNNWNTHIGSIIGETWVYNLCAKLAFKNKCKHKIILLNDIPVTGPISYLPNRPPVAVATCRWPVLDTHGKYVHPFNGTTGLQTIGMKVISVAWNELSIARVQKRSSWRCVVCLQHFLVFDIVQRNLYYIL